MIKDFKQSNFYYIFNLIIKNYLKLIFFLIIGLIFGYFLHYNSERHLIIQKRISPIDNVNHVLAVFINSDSIMNDFIKINRERISKAEYNRIFEFDENSINKIDKIPDLYNQKIPSNISYEKYLEISKNFTYLKQRIDYQYNTYALSKRIKFKKHNKKLEERSKKLKNDFNDYLWLTNQITRSYFFNTIFNNPSFYRDLVDIYKSNLIIVKPEDLGNKLFETNAKEIKKITRLLKILISDLDQNTQKINNLAGLNTKNIRMGKENQKLILDSISQMINEEFLIFGDNGSPNDKKRLTKKQKNKLTKEQKNKLTKEQKNKLIEEQIFLYSNKTVNIEPTTKLEYIKKEEPKTKEPNKDKNLKEKKFNLEEEKFNIEKELMKLNIKAGDALDNLFRVSFKYSVNGLENDFDLKIIEKTAYYYLIICSLISLTIIINIIVIRDFIKNLKKS